MRLLNRSHVLSFEGGHVDLGKDAAFDLVGALTIAAWVNPTAGTKMQATILSKNYTAYEPQVQNSRFVFERGPEYKSNGRVAMNAWVHLAVTFDAAAEDDTLRLYIDGSLDRGFKVADPLAKTAARLLIGKRPGWADGLFSGLMGGLAIWSAARSAWEIKQGVNAPVDTGDPTLVGYWPMDAGSGTTLADASAGKHDGELMGPVSWVPLDAPIAIARPGGQLLRNTSVEVLAQSLAAPRGRQVSRQAAPTVLAVAAQAAPAPETPPALMTLTPAAAVPPTSPPPSGRNGAAMLFLNRVEQYKQQQIQAKTLESNARVAQAKRAKAQQLDDAHAEAARKINSARFDRLFFLYRSRLHSVDSKHVVEEFFVGTTSSQTLTVDARQVWQKTNKLVATNESVKIRYVSGRWSVSSDASNLTALGAGRFKGKDSYALPGANEGALIGRLGSAVFEIGNGTTLPAGLSGNLELAANDDVTGKYGKGYKDNSGAVTVEIVGETEPVDTAATDLAVDPLRKKIFWAQSTAPFSLHLADVDGNNHKVIIANPGEQGPGKVITSIALDTLNQRVYAIVDAKRIVSATYDGGDQRDVVDISGPTREGFWQLDIDEDNKQLYWTNDYGIWCANLNGKKARMVVPAHDAPYPLDLTVDGEGKKLYWVDRELKVVRRANLDGSNPEDLYEVAHPVRGLTLDEVLPEQQATLKREVYWSAWEERITAATPGIAGRWALNEGRGDELGNAAAPFAPTGRSAVLSETRDLPPPLRAQPGPDALALRFEGPADYLTLPQNRADALYGGSFTVQLWVKVASLPDKDLALLSAGSVAENSLIHLVIRGGTAFLGFYGSDTAGKTPIKTDRWVHLAFRYDADKQEQAIFVDGAPDSAEAGHKPAQVAAGTLARLGRSPGGQDFVGLLADLHIVDRALTATEIAIGRTRLSPGDVLREIGLGPQWIYDDVPPLVHRSLAALAFDGRDDYVKLPSAKQLGLTDGSFTVECWFNAAEIVTGDMPLVGSDIGEASKGLHLIIRDGKPFMGFFGDDLPGKTAIEAGRWYHIAFRFDAETREQAIFLDGVQTAKRNAKQAFLGEDPLFLGRWNYDRLFKGSIAELRIWRVARNADEILVNLRNHRETFVIRAAVDGAGDPEHLVEVPSEGGLNLVSKLSAAHETRLLAYRARKQAQAQAARDVAAAHGDYDQRVAAKGEELDKTHSAKAAEIAAKSAAHEQVRTDNRNRLNLGKNAATRRVEDAKQQSTIKRRNAESQASSITNNAHGTAAKLKGDAKKKRDDAQRARAQYR